MRLTFFKSLLATSLALTFLLTLAAPKAVSNQGGGGRLEGTWEVVLTPQDCETGVPRPFSFRELATFMFGGTMIDSTSAPAATFTRTPGHGVWNHVSGDIYSFKFKILTVDKTTNTLTGWTIVSQEAVLNDQADSYTSVGKAETYDALGNLTMTGCSSTTATPFE